MSDNQNLATQSTSLAKSAFARELAKREVQGGTFIACDGSGSMNESTENPGERRVDALRSIVYGLRQQHAQFRMYIFESSVYETDMIPEPTGSTNMAEAFDYAAKNGCKHLVLISDGCPDSPDFALRAAQNLVESGCKRIDVFYVGPKGAFAQGAVNFMEKLAKLTGANINSVRFDQLEDGVRKALALTADAESLQEKQSGGAIAL